MADGFGAVDVTSRVECALDRIRTRGMRQKRKDLLKTSRVRRLDSCRTRACRS
ncbi:hypothetical protein SAMN05421752_10544 [Natronorubrum thiooxidans]|uniref:Uncharacterized protein n=1 Tax=Natronorubrum thiooxidans TaxID=308853 RepID=A0A1N7ETW8_9EURY|nr:hypothetical protein SAMN05421752_10544 [Natronorubrum thiooxidans]